MGVIKAAIGVCLAFVCLCGALTGLSFVVVPSCRSVTAQYDTAVVLGGGMHRDGRLAADTAIRVAEGVALYQAGKVGQLHMTGGGWSPLGITVGQSMARAALDAGVPPDAVTLEDLSQSTLQNAQFSLPMLDPAQSIIKTSA